MLYYFVSYAYECKDSPYVFACNEESVDAPITGIKALRNISERINDRNAGDGRVTILNYIFLREEPDAK